MCLNSSQSVKHRWFWSVLSKTRYDLSYTFPFVDDIQSTLTNITWLLGSVVILFTHSLTILWSKVWKLLKMLNQLRSLYTAHIEILKGLSCLALSLVLENFSKILPYVNICIWHKVFLGGSKKEFNCNFITKLWRARRPPLWGITCCLKKYS